ncbi:huntingtin-like [Aricia agestis]|uniref:huntingtin-like n=1 Tax=Aricia agestis TaxID=91739 RepID=UPI001C2027EC|nr:huntingtin-like [Aricia agestis]
MNVLEKAEKSLEYLKNSVDSTSKYHELQAAASALGRCSGILGSRHAYARHYANLLPSSIPILLNLASHDSAEVRLLGDEALNNCVAGGLAFHSHKINIILQNQIDSTKNARWIRAALSRVCLGDCWLRPGVGKIRSQAQTLIPKLSQIVRQTSETQLIVEALENNLPRILNALAEYTTDEEVSELSKSLLPFVESSEPAIRRGVANCVAHLCSHREPLLTNLLAKVYDKLWPLTRSAEDDSAKQDAVVLGWFSIIKAIFQVTDIEKFQESDVFSVQDYLKLYKLCIDHLEVTTTEHNIQNTILECLSVLLGQARGEYRRALLEKNPRVVSLDDRSDKGHRRNMSYSSAISSRTVASAPLESREPEITFSGALQLGSLLQLATPSLSVEDLNIETPSSPAESDADIRPDPEQLSHDVAEKLQGYESDVVDDVVVKDGGVKINIGSSADEDVRLKYCIRLLASKFLLTGNKGGVISNRCVKVSVKSSALTCIAAIMQLYPQAATLYLDKDADMKFQNYSGSSEGTDSNQDHINEFILERNICYQDSITESLSQDLLIRSSDSQAQISKKDSKSLEKSTDSELKSSKDVPSNILDSKANLVASGFTDGTNVNMSNSNFTTNSNMTASNDHMSTGYPMSSSGDVLSSSIDLDMKFDHFGDSTTNLESVKYETQKEVTQVEQEKMEVDDREFEFQHISDIFVLLECYSDPQVRGLVRVCIGNYLVSALDLSHGDYHRWRNYSALPKDVSDNISTERLLEILLKGLTDEIHSTVNHTLSSLTQVAVSLCNSVHCPLLANILNALVAVQNNTYWLCRVNLAKLYEKLPYQRLFMLHPGYKARSKLIMDTLYGLLKDKDQRVRTAAAQAIASIVPKIYPSPRATATTMMAQLAAAHSKLFQFNTNKTALNLVREIYFYNDLPEQLKVGDMANDVESLSVVIGDLMTRLMASNSKNYLQGLLETLQAICRRWSPWKHIEAYSGHGILNYCLHHLENCNGNVMARTMLLDIARLVYPVSIHNIMHNKTNRDIFERDNPESEKWHYLDNAEVAALSEKFFQVTLKMMNLLVHLIEEINPNVHINKSSIALPGSPVRKKTQDTSQRKSNTTEDEKTLKKRASAPANTLRANFAGHFYREPFYMKLYDSLRATYSNHKINLDPKSSIFYKFLSTTLNCLAIQLEMATVEEYGHVTEEILYYLKAIMSFCPELTVNCITQLLKCLFGTSMINQYSDYMSIADPTPKKSKSNLFEDVMLINQFKSDDDDDKNLLMMMENFARNRTDRKWGTNKEELGRYIRLFEPVVIQSLKSYTFQNDIPLQVSVLRLLCQLLSLRVNYCMLDSDQVFIGYLLRQLELVEQHEIPNCCDLVNGILLFLVQLSSSKHHTKQIIELPKLLQLCDGLLAAGALDECIAGLQPVAVKVFSNMGGTSVLGKAQQTEAQATREVLFYMLQKTMHQPKVLELISSVLSLTRDQPESHYRWSELAADTLLNLLSERSLLLEKREAVEALETLLDVLYRDVLLEQSRVEILLKILFKAPPDQATTPKKLKIRYLIIIMVLLRKVLIYVPETEILLSINYLKSTCIAPESIFFNVKPNVDPLNVQNVNENCANLSPDVILVRFLFKTLTYAILEMDDFQTNLDLVDSEYKEQNRLIYSVCVNIIVQVKHMLHLTDGCLFPLTAMMARTILHNEQDGLNTGLYSPDENFPLDALNLVCLKCAHRAPLLTVHWSHLLIRLNLLSHKYWHKLVGFVRGVPLNASGDSALLRADLLQSACVLAYCEYFVDNGLSQAVHLTWLLVNRIHVIVSQYNEEIVRQLVKSVQAAPAASALLLQAVAARCQACLKDEFALNTHKILSACHESQSGALMFLICRIVGKMEPAIAIRFTKLAIDRCALLRGLPPEVITSQLSKEDVQVALEMLQRDRVHVRYPTLVVEINALASTVFDLSPLDLNQDRAINPHYIHTTNVDGQWLVNQIKSRCCQKDDTSKHYYLACSLAKLSSEDITTIMSCPEFDRQILKSCFQISCDTFIKDFLNLITDNELREAEIEAVRERREMEKMKEEMTSSIDSNKLNVANTLHVFKKSDNKESKSQFFISYVSDAEVTDKMGSLEIADEEIDIVIPDLPKLYQVGVTVLDKSLADLLKVFPKQSRPLSQSENFNLNNEHTIDRYTRRCHQVFQDKQFYQEFLTIHTILDGFLECINKIMSVLDETDCDLLEKCFENILPNTLARNVAVFSVVSLQYLSFLVKNKKTVETPVHADVSFRVNNTATDHVSVDYIILKTLENVAKALRVNEIFAELNVEINLNRNQSAINCLYAVVKFLVKDKKPLILKPHMNYQGEGPKPDIIITCEKIITLIDYWEENFYEQQDRHLLGARCRKPIEDLLVSLARLELLSNAALIPPIAWSSVDAAVSKDHLQRIDLPLQALQDMDVLEKFLFRVNLIGWSSKKQFEEIWVGLLGALQGNGAHWAVQGVTQLLLAAGPVVRGKGPLHIPRAYVPLTDGMARLRNILVGTSAYSIFENLNLERVAMKRNGNIGFHYGQFSTEYLKCVSGLNDGPSSLKVRREVKRTRKNEVIDINSCIQILMDVTIDMLDPKANTGAAARVALVRVVSLASGVFRREAHWARAAAALAHPPPPPAPAAPALQALATCLPVIHGHEQELSTVHEKLLKSLSSSFAPNRQASLRGWLLLLNRHTPADIIALLRDKAAQNVHSDKISVYEQSLYWAILFRAAELGSPDLVTVAVDFVLTKPRHYCTELVVKGITTVLRQQVLPKDLKNNIIERLTKHMQDYPERHAIRILMVHLFSADSKLISPKLESDVSNMDPDVLMNSMERITLLYKLLRQSKSRETKHIVVSVLKYFLRETLPPAATLSRVVIEFLECCKETEKKRIGLLSERDRWIENSVLTADVVFEVFETSISQDQLPVLSFWIFEALCHLVFGKISTELLPYCLLTLLVSANSNTHIRTLRHLSQYIFKLGFHNTESKSGIFDIANRVTMSFADRRLLCIVSLHSEFNGNQYEKWKEMCEENESLKDVLQCMSAEKPGNK